MVDTLENFATLGQENAGGPQPAEKPTANTVSSLDSFADLSSDREPDIKLFLEKHKKTPRQVEASELAQKFEQDKMRDSLLGINVGIAEMLDIPTEVSAMILRQIPLFKNVRGDPFGTLFRAFNFSPDKGKEPDSSEFRVGKVVGNGIATLPAAPFGAAVNVTSKSGVIARTAKTIGETAVKSPGKFAATEGAASLGAGVGMEAAQTAFPDSPFATFVGGTIGGVSPQLMPFKLAINSARAIRQRVTNFRTKGQNNAGKELDRAATDIEKAGKELHDPNLLSEAQATAAQKTGDPGIMALERAVIDRSHKSIYDADQQIAKMNQAVNNSLRLSDDVLETTRATLADQKKYLGQLIETNLQMARRNALEAVEKLGPSATAEQANAIARKEIVAVETLARNDEKVFWNAVPRDTPVRSSTATDVFRKILLKEFDSRSFKGRKNLPDDLELEKFLGNFHTGKNKNRFFKGGEFTKKANMGELQDLRSDVLRAIREERAKPASNNHTISILEDIQEALLQDMGVLTGGQGTPEGHSLRLALDYSRKVNEMFNRGIVGKLKGVDKVGTIAIPEALTLETAFGGKPAKAAENIRQMIKASKGVDGKLPPNVEMLGAMEDFVKKDFAAKVVRGEKIDVFKAEKYLERNIKILDEFPEIRNDIQRAIKTEDLAAIRQRKSDSFTARVPVGKMSKATLFIEKSPRKMFESLEASRPEDFNREMQNLLNKVNKDSTGEALEGLQMSFFDWLKQRSMTGISDISGQKFISGQALNDIINNPKIAAMMGKILDKGQIERLRKIVNTALVMDKSRIAKAIDSNILEGGESKMITTIMRILGAKSGAAISHATGGGASGLQTAAIMSERFKAAVSGLSIKDPAARLLLDAFADDSGELLKALLTHIDSPQKAERVTAQIHAWAASVAYQSGDKALAENVEDR